MNTVRGPGDIFGYPQSRSGKISVGLIALALTSAGFLGVTELLISGLFASESILHAGWMVAPVIALALCGVLAVLAAVISAVVEHERSVFIGFAFLVGLILTHASINGLQDA